MVESRLEIGGTRILKLERTRQRELALVDWAFISGTLVIFALMCFCIVVFAHEANRSSTAQTQSVLRVPTPAANSPSRSQSEVDATSWASLI